MAQCHQTSRQETAGMAGKGRALYGPGEGPDWAVTNGSRVSRLVCQKAHLGFEVEDGLEEGISPQAESHRDREEEAYLF